MYKLFRASWIVLAALGFTGLAAIALSLSGPTQCELHAARIRPGMTADEVSQVVYRTNDWAGTFSHDPEIRVGSGDGSGLVVVFDKQQRVIHAYAELPKSPMPRIRNFVGRVYNRLTVGG
jgi:hypothetical protein